MTFFTFSLYNLIIVFNASDFNLFHIKGVKNIQLTDLLKVYEKCLVIKKSYLCHFLSAYYSREPLDFFIQLA